MDFEVLKELSTLEEKYNYLRVNGYDQGAINEILASIDDTTSEVVTEPQNNEAPVTEV